MNDNYQAGCAVLHSQCGDIWSITPERFRALAEMVGREPLAGIGETKTFGTRQTAGQVAVLQLHGAVSQHGGWWSVSTDALAEKLDDIAADSGIDRVVLDIDSPGGSVFGVDELAAKIRGMRDKTPIIAVVNSLCASAAYYIASACSKIVMTPGGLVGSIGVYHLHLDYSGALEQDGIKPTFIFAGKHKVDGNPYEPLNDAAREETQERVTRYYRAFLNAVARGRGMSYLDVARNFGQGRLFQAKQALEVSMIDGIATLSDVLKSHGRAPSQTTAVIGERIAALQSRDPLKSKPTKADRQKQFKAAERRQRIMELKHKR